MNNIKGRTARGLRNAADSPIASSMYFLSSGVIVGWAAGLSYDTRIQNIYQNIPTLPGRRRERKQKTQTWVQAEVAAQTSFQVHVVKLNCVTFYNINSWLGRNFEHLIQTHINP